jgi:hypothetical protein
MLLTMLSEDDLLVIPKQTLAAPQKIGKVGSKQTFNQKPLSPLASPSCANTKGQTRFRK